MDMFRIGHATRSENCMLLLEETIRTLGTPGELDFQFLGDAHLQVCASLTHPLRYVQVADACSTRVMFGDRRNGPILTRLDGTQFALVHTERVVPGDRRRGAIVYCSCEVLVLTLSENSHYSALCVDLGCSDGLPRAYHYDTFRGAWHADLARTTMTALLTSIGITRPGVADVVSYTHAQTNTNCGIAVLSVATELDALLRAGTVTRDPVLRCATYFEPLAARSIRDDGMLVRVRMSLCERAQSMMVALFDDAACNPGDVVGEDGLVAEQIRALADTGLAPACVLAAMIRDQAPSVRVITAPFAAPAPQASERVRVFVDSGAIAVALCVSPGGPGWELAVPHTPCAASTQDDCGASAFSALCARLAAMPELGIVGGVVANIPFVGSALGSSMAVLELGRWHDMFSSWNMPLLRSVSAVLTALWGGTSTRALRQDATRASLLAWHYACDAVGQHYSRMIASAVPMAQDAKRFSLYHPTDSGSIQTHLSVCHAIEKSALDALNAAKWHIVPCMSASELPRMYCKLAEAEQLLCNITCTVEELLRALRGHSITMSVAQHMLEPVIQCLIESWPVLFVDARQRRSLPVHSTEDAMQAIAENGCQNINIVMFPVAVYRVIRRGRRTASVEELENCQDGFVCIENIEPPVSGTTQCSSLPRPDYDVVCPGQWRPSEGAPFVSMTDIMPLFDVLRLIESKKLLAPGACPPREDWGRIDVPSLHPPLADVPCVGETATRRSFLAVRGHDTNSAARARPLRGVTFHDSLVPAVFLDEKA